MKVPTSQALPLRDIHLPPAISWWPLAPGWWTLAALIVGAAVAWLAFRRRRRRPASPRKRALGELRAMEQSRGEADPRTQTRDLSVLLRRVSLSYYPREKVAGLVGGDWLNFLDDILGERRFSEGPGRTLLDAPYRPPGPADVAALHALCVEWMRALPDRPLPDAAPRRRLFRHSKRASRTAPEATLSNGRK